MEDDRAISLASRKGFLLSASRDFCVSANDRLLEPVKSGHECVRPPACRGNWPSGAIRYGRRRSPVDHPWNPSLDPTGQGRYPEPTSGGLHRL